MAKVYFIATLVILQGLFFYAQPKHFSNFCSFDNGNYNMSWMYNATTDKLYFVVEVAAVGWVGFGLATNAPTGMMGYDVAVGGVYNGTSYLKDYLTVGQVQPRLDTQQDWYLTYSSEVNNVTTLKFHRIRNTSDSNDTAVQQGESIYVIWAYHYTDDVNLMTWMFTKHTQRGFQSKTLIPAAAQPTNVHFSNFCSFDNGNYNMSWMYNATTDKLYFVVQVKAVGWVGFGLASNAPTNMIDYDVAVGGVYNGTSYLKDYLTVGQVLPRLDTQQDWYLTYSSEVDSVTTLKFHRMRNTSDSNDTAVQQGESIYVIWAYHYTDDVNLTTWSFNKHSQKGFQSKILIPATVSSTASVYMAASAVDMSASAVNMSASAVDMSPSAVDMSPSAVDMSPSAVDMSPSAVDMSPSAVDMSPSAVIMPSSSTSAGPSSISTTAPPNPTTSPVHFPNFCSFDNGTYNMSWMCNTTCNGTKDQNWICFVVQVKATGWIGFGLANKAPNNMIGYDVAVGGVYDNGTCYLKDYNTTGQMQPTLDVQQDWKLCNCSQEKNVTTLKFCRKLDTGDINDIPIKPGMPKFIVWAYHSTNDIRPNCTFDQHTKRGFVQKLLKKETTTTPTPTPSPSPSPSPKTPDLPIPSTGISPGPTSSVAGITISYKPKSGECDRVCCNGAGGPLTVEGSCSPTDKCAGIELADKQEDGHCPGESRGTCKCGSEGFHNSNFALIILMGIATFMKNSF